MEAIAALLEQAERGKADLEMLGYSRLIERARRPRKLNLPVQRLVRDAKQRAIGNAQAKSLSGDRAALHVDGNRAREIDAPALLCKAQFPIAVVIGDDGAGAQALLQRLAAIPG